jgi:hypothetical protein
MPNTAIVAAHCSSTIHSAHLPDNLMDFYPLDWIGPEKAPCRNVGLRRLGRPRFQVLDIFRFSQHA